MASDFIFRSGGKTISILAFAACGLILLSYRYKEKNLVIVPFKANEPTDNTNTWQATNVENYKTLRNTANDLKNYWLYFRSVVNQTEFRNQVNTIDEGYTIINSRIFDLMDKSAVERKRQLDDVAYLIRQRMDKLQNPRNCKRAKKVSVDITKAGCGFGCTLHSIVGGFLKAYLTNQTFVLHSENWHYAEEGWEYAFLPISRCKAPNLSDDHEEIVQYGWRPPGWVAWRLPEDLEPLLKELHGDPFAWWIAQFTSYVFRLQPFIQKQLNNFATEIGFTDSVVGVQIRWGDKIRNEASKHEVDEYMFYVERWFQQLEFQGNFVERVVYLACEEKLAWKQMKERYPRYKFIGNIGTTEVKGPRFRYKHEGLENVIMDIHFLSRCSYVVCTLSSSVCRTAYELMMNKYDDASVRIQTLDSSYRLKTSGLPIWEAVMDHDPVWSDELSLKKGDQVEVDIDPFQSFNDGYLRGTNQRTSKKGKFPVFKAREIVLPYNQKELEKALRSDERKRERQKPNV